MTKGSKFIPEFSGQREDEEILMVLNKHWYTIAMPLAKGIVIIFLSFLIPIWTGFMGTIFSYAAGAIVYYLWIMFWIGYILYEYYQWYRDKFIITDHRIIDIDQKGLFTRRVSEIELDRIQNVTYTVAGFFQTLFNFGTVTIQSAGNNELTLRQIADPATYQREITTLVKKVTEDEPVSAEELLAFIKDKRI
ncbi:hypothetical protein DRH29_03840 [candidate division Kazan bacterium]|uniref:YdbS-like PH domain-containing protein n=1 Tax=candidate division Kazan bacterium TaxID=2202143 RepID=A0A420ZBT4_UNCK3|nr:MAG: hypothetical protein DRH29_03840 [candidate division Kazan bacterium]